MSTTSEEKPKQGQRCRLLKSRHILLAAVTALNVAALAASADTYTYVGPNSGASANWNRAANWSDTSNGNAPGVPGSVTVDDAYIAGYYRVVDKFIVPVVPTVTLDTSPFLNSLNLDLADLTQATANTLIQTKDMDVDGSGDFAQSAGQTNASTVEWVGNSGFGTEELSGGTHTVDNYYLGNATTGNGALTLSETALLQVGGNELVGSQGTGTVTQTGGENSITSVDESSLILADFNDATGTYNMSGTTSVLYVSGGDEDIGLRGTGTFTQSAGNNTIDGGWSLSIATYGGSTGTFTLSGTGTVSLVQPQSGVYVGGNLYGSGGTGTLNVQGGTLNTPTLCLYPTGTVNQNGGTITAGSTVNDASITQTVGNASLGPLTGTGSLFIGAASGSPATTTAAGFKQSSVTIYSTGLLTLNGGTANTVKALSISGGGQLDLTNRHLFINYSGSTDPVSTIRGYLATGFNGGLWNGPGIESSTAAANSNYALGFADSADGVVNGLASGNIEIAYTLYGDINLDGAVNGSDFAILATNFGKTVTGGWDQGDLNFNGTVNGSDFSLLAENFGKTASGAAVSLPTSEWDALDSFAAAHGLLADVPEPTSTFLGAASCACFFTMRRRRRIGAIN